MRKCAACGYLLFGDGDTCNHCGAAVPVVAATATASASAAASAAPPAARTAAPATARLAPAPPEPRLWRPPPAPAPAPPSAAPVPVGGASAPPSPWAPPPSAPPQFVNEGIWRPDPQPIVTGPARTTPRRGMLAMCVVVALLLGGVAYAVNAARNALPSGTSAFVAGKGVPYTAPDESFTVQFPVAPHAETQPITVQGAQLEIHEASVEAPDYEMAAASVVLPVSVPQDQVDRLLDDALSNGFAGVHGTVTSSQHITRGGLPAVDARVKGPDGYGARVEVISWNNKLYLFGVHAKSGVDRLFAAMDTSLSLR